MPPLPGYPGVGIVQDMVTRFVAGVTVSAYNLIVHIYKCTYFCVELYIYDTLHYQA